jgi:hypothetical protein
MGATHSCPADKNRFLTLKRALQTLPCLPQQSRIVALTNHQETKHIVLVGEHHYRRPQIQKHCVLLASVLKDVLSCSAQCSSKALLFVEPTGSQRLEERLHDQASSMTATESLRYRSEETNIANANHSVIDILHAFPECARFVRMQDGLQGFRGVFLESVDDSYCGDVAKVIDALRHHFFPGATERDIQSEQGSVCNMPSMFFSVSPHALAANPAQRTSPMGHLLSLQRLLYFCLFIVRKLYPGFDRKAAGENLFYMIQFVGNNARSAHPLSMDQVVDMSLDAVSWLTDILTVQDMQTESATVGASLLISYWGNAHIEHQQTLLETLGYRVQTVIRDDFGPEWSSLK